MRPPTSAKEHAAELARIASSGFSKPAGGRLFLVAGESNASYARVQNSSARHALLVSPANRERSCCAARIQQLKNASLGNQSGRRCESEDVTGWKTQPRIVRKLAEHSARCQATLGVKTKLILCPRKFRLPNVMPLSCWRSVTASVSGVLRSVVRF